MKPILNTIITLCFSSLCSAQHHENTLFNYSESIKRSYEMQFDSLPYQAAICNYFNDPKNDPSKMDCPLLPDESFRLTYAEFLILQGKYSEALIILNNYIHDKSNFNSQYPDLYLEALLLKSSAYIKMCQVKMASQTIQQLDEFAYKSSNRISKNVEFKIRNTKASLALHEDNYQKAASFLKPVVEDSSTLNETDVIINTDAMMLMGEMLLKLNQQDSAFVYFNKSKIRLLTLFKPEHFKFCRLYIDLANYYRNSGQFSESEIFYLKAISIFKLKIGTNHPDMANMLRMLANLYRRTGRFDLADLNYNESLHIQKQIGFDESTLCAITLSNQGLLYTLIGKRKEAEQLFLNAKSKLEINADTIDLDYAGTLENLANLFYNQLKLDAAESLYSKSMQIRKPIQGESHSDYAECLNSLGNIYQKRENYIIAQSYYEQAINIVAETKNKNKVCPHFYNNLALLYSKTNQLEKAESLFTEVKILYENQFGKMNRTYLSLLENMAELYAKLNNQEKATEYYIEASKLRKKIIYDSFRYLSSNEIEGYLQRFRRGIANFNNYLIQSKSSPDLLLIEAYESELFYKGFLMNYHLELNNIIETKPEFAYLSDSIKSIYQMLAKEYTKYPLSITTIDSLEEIAHKLEKQLGTKMEAYKELIRIIHFDDLITSLKPHEALVEIMYLNLNPEINQDSVAYAAMVIPYGSSAPVFVNLCKEEELNKLFLKTKTLNGEYVNTLYSMNSRGLIPIEKNKNGLYELIWKKLEVHLKDVQTIYYVPAGLMHKINIQAIPITRQVVSGMNYNILQLSSSRQLLNMTHKLRKFHSALIMGGIQYDELQNPNHFDSKLVANSRGLKITALDHITENYWPELSNTYREIYQLNELFKKSKIHSKKFIGSEASEETFKKRISEHASPDIIHIATHGYFFPETTGKDKIENNKRSCPFMNSKDPMMRSGLVLAYGNYAWQNCEPIPGHKEDGILTAFEISQMNLHNTQLAVLSACETGLGDIKGTEGVYGLQRAFKIAGVKYLIMSLWQIPDFQTEELMLLFYTNLLREKMEIPKAFKKAQMEMRSKYNDPYFWAGFVLVQ